MTAIYLVGCGLYVPLLILGVWLIAKETDGRALFHYYKPDNQRGSDRREVATEVAAPDVVSGLTNASKPPDEANTVKLFFAVG